MMPIMEQYAVVFHVIAAKTAHLRPLLKIKDVERRPEFDMMPFGLKSNFFGSPQ